jgi:DNA-binding NtrC family response regulator
MMIRAAVADRAPNPRRVLVVSADRRMASQTAQWLCGRGWHARAVGQAEEALRRIERECFAACVVDGMLPDDGAARITAGLRRAGGDTGIVVAMPAGRQAVAEADRVVVQPTRDDDLLEALEAAATAATARQAALGAGGTRLVGRSAAIERVRGLVARLADAPATVLITGESGTGKSLLAREIHRQSRRRGGRFVEVACGCLSETLLESELFGHVAGAFTGATAAREGRFLQADGGTIFLDEIATASPSLQVKLLRVLQDLEFEPVGGSQTHAVDARVILATHEDLSALVAAGRFRADLFWRVNVITIEMPSLRQRAEDIPLLAGHFLRQAAVRGGRDVSGFTADAVEALVAYAWPGNVRELAHAVEHAVLLGQGELATLADLPPTVRQAAACPRLAERAGPAIGTGPAVPPTAGALKRSLASPERQLILEALERNGWRRDAAARALGINRTTLYKKLKRLGMSIRDLQPTR